MAKRLALLMALGFLVRAAFLLLEPAARPMGDEPSWLDLADRLPRTRHPFSPFKHRFVFYPPVYPYFVAVLWKAFGSLAAVKWAQVALGALLVPAVGRVGAQVFSQRVGLVAAAITAFYPTLVWFSVHFWSETLFMLLLYWAFERALACFASASRGAAAASGMLCGLSILTRETALYFAPVIAAWLAWRGRPTRRSVTCGALFLLTTLLTVAPWTYRNWVVFRAFVPVSTMGSLNLWEGNSRLPRDEVYLLSDAVEGPIAQSRLAWRNAWDVIRERQPTWLLEKLVVELPRFWVGSSEAIHHVDRGAYRNAGPGSMRLAQLLTIPPYLLVLALAIPALFAPRWREMGSILLLFVLYYNAIHVVTHAMDRFRLVIMPILFVAAAFTWVGWRERSFPQLGTLRRALAWATGLVLALTQVSLFF